MAAKMRALTSFPYVDLTSSQFLEIYRYMLLARTLSQRGWLLNRQGKAFFMMPTEGSEAADVGSAYAIRRGQDFILPYPRDLGAALVFGLTARDIMLNLLARAEDPVGAGKNMPLHLGSKRLHIINQSSPTGTQIPQAVGIAMAAKLLHKDEVALCYFGDGASNKGDFHEGLNMAAIFNAPVIFFCVNNGLALSMPANKHIAGGSIAARGHAYAIPGVKVDGIDPIEVHKATKEALERARSGAGPSLIEAVTVRLMPHSSTDDHSLYRTREELEAERQRDPLPRYQKTLMELGLLTGAKDEAMRRKVLHEVDAAIAYAEAAPFPKPEEALGPLFV
jgi:2-oxoisovalerate dehydrogenase E1 component alpha subunit